MKTIELCVKHRRDDKYVFKNWFAVYGEIALSYKSDLVKL
jgi:hypothetical protein